MSETDGIENENIDKDPHVLAEERSQRNQNVHEGSSGAGTHDPNPMPAGCGCSGDKDVAMENSSPVSYVYAIGKITHRFPTRSIELELAQATGRIPEEETKGNSREDVIYKALTDPANRYIARQICYVLKVEDLETYILIPSDAWDIDRLAEALRPSNVGDFEDIDIIIGKRGGLAPYGMCNGLVVPIVMVDQIYSFDKNALLKAIPKRRGENESQFKKTANELFNHIIQIADNAGATDEQRALNYLAVRYDEIYHRTQTMQNENYSFTGVDVRASRLSGPRKVLDVIFSYENRANRALQKWFARVDVTEEFPFLVTAMQEYFER